MAASIQLRAQGIEALKTRQFNAAADLLNRYLDSAPNDMEAELALAAARAGQGKHFAALTIYERNLEREPRSPSLHFNRGATLERLGRKDDAVKAYKMALRLKPDHAKARQRLEALGGIAPPQRARPAADIPTVMAVDDDNIVTLPAKGGWWIHPAALAGLLLFVAVLIAAAIYTMPAYEAGVCATGAVFSALMLLAGLQAIAYARRGSGRYPAPVGYVLLCLGALGLVNTFGFTAFRVATADWQAIQLAQKPKPNLPPPVAPGQAAETLAKRAQERAEAKLKADANAVKARVAAEKAKKVARGLEVDAALVKLKNSDKREALIAAMALASGPSTDRRADVASALEKLLGDDDANIRFWAAVGLKSWGSTKSIEKLKALSADPDTGVQSAANRAIEALQKQPSGETKSS